MENKKKRNASTIPGGEGEISFFTGQRARDAMFPVQATAKKVYLGVFFPATCSLQLEYPAWRWTFALRREAHEKLGIIDESHS